MYKIDTGHYGDSHRGEHYEVFSYIEVHEYHTKRKNDDKAHYSKSIYWAYKLRLCETVRGFSTKKQAMIEAQKYIERARQEMLDVVYKRPSSINVNGQEIY